MDYKRMMYGDNHIVTSGSVIVLDDEDITFIFELDSPIDVTVKFVSNDEKPEIDIDIDETEDGSNQITVRFANFNSSFGGGSIEPMSVLEYHDGSTLFLNAWVTKFDKRTRRFDYTFFWTGDVGYGDEFA